MSLRKLALPIILAIPLALAFIALEGARRSPREKLKKLLGLPDDLSAQDVMIFDEKFCQKQPQYPLTLSQDPIECSRLEMSLDDRPLISYFLRPSKPHGKADWPAVVLLHGHLSQASDLAGITTSSMVWPLGRLLAGQGFAVLMPQDRWGAQDTLKELHNALRLLPAGKTLTGERVADVLRMIQYLRSRPDIDPARIGVLGWSMGGDVALYSAVFDREIKTVYLSSSMGSFYDLIKAKAPLHTPDNYLPSILKEFEDKGRIAGLLYPRPILIEHGANDEVNRFASADESARYLARAYKSRAQKRLYFLKHSLAHRFYGGRASIWFKQWL